MTLRHIAHWARSRTAAEWLALAGGLAVFGYVGWDGALWDARFQLLLHLLAFGAILGLAVLAWRGGQLPRTPIDVPILALLAAFALATISAVNLGMSLRAMAAITATAAMLPIALVAIRHRPTWVGVVAAVPVLVLSIPALLVLVARRAEWVLVGAPGLPPIRLPSEGTPFGSVAVPPFVIWSAWALAGLIESSRWRRVIQAGLVMVGLPLTVLSGSRSAWLAIAVAALVWAVPWAWQRRHAGLRLLRRPSRRTILIAGAATLGTLAIAVLIAPRVLAVTSLLYRASLWRDTLNAWATDPFLGIGPGFMPYARLAAAPDYSFPVRQPHSHNLPLGVLGDAGVIGLVAAVVLVVVILRVAGPWRSRTPKGRAAALVLLGLGVGGLFEDLTFLPNFNLLAIGVLALALTDADAVQWVRLRPRARRLLGVATAAPGLVLLSAMVASDAGAVAYRAGIDAANEERWADATEHFERASAIDAWHPAGPKSLAVAADAAGLTPVARDAAERATLLSPGDASSWTNLALLCANVGDRACQLRATERSVATAGFFEAELVNAAFSYVGLGRPDEADDAYRRSLLSQRLTALATDWPRQLAIGAGDIGDNLGPLADLNRVLAWWSMDEAIRVDRISDPAVRAFAHAVRGEREEAALWLERAVNDRPAEILTWDVAVVLMERWGLPIDHALAVGGVVRGSPLPARDLEPRPPGLTFDVGSFRAYPRDGLVTSAVRLRTSPPYPWSLEQALP